MRVVIFRIHKIYSRGYHFDKKKKKFETDEFYRFDISSP